MIRPANANGSYAGPVNAAPDWPLAAIIAWANHGLDSLQTKIKRMERLVDYLEFRFSSSDLVVVRLRDGTQLGDVLEAARRDVPDFAHLVDTNNYKTVQENAIQRATPRLVAMTAGRKERAQVAPRTRSPLYAVIRWPYVDVDVILLVFYVV